MRGRARPPAEQHHAWNNGNEPPGYRIEFRLDVLDDLVDKAGERLSQSGIRSLPPIDGLADERDEKARDDVVPIHRVESGASVGDGVRVR